ncbi:MAG: hypothetical protein KatS3mg027_0076 [Bacteroidia bacterium]|nr:MAG: hypothetical protein KatS3mg027_0076 [Bacteroidia bacterium]
MRKNFFLIVSSTILITIVFFFSSCKKEKFAYWDVDLVSPIARGTLNIKNFFGDSLFQSDNNQILHLKFFKKVGDIKVDTLVKLKDTTLTYSFVALFTATVGPNTMLFYKDEEIDFQIPNDARLRYGIVKEGTLKVKYTNTTRFPLLFQYKLKSATQNSSNFFITEIIPPGNTPTIKTYNFDGYDLNFTGISGNKYNTIVHSFTVYTAPNAQPDSIIFGQGINAEISYEKIIPQYIEGYFGQQDIRIPYDSAVIGFSKTLEASNFQINSAYINFHIVNDFGVDIQGSLDTVNSINTTNSSVVKLNANSLNSININRATKTGNWVNPVNSTTTTININTNNSNLKPFIENLPNYLGYSGRIKVNPNGNISATNDFAYYNTGIRIFADIDVPLKFSADYFRLQDVLDINFENVKQLNNVNEGRILFNISNNYPFKVKLQAYLLDANNSILDSLILPTNNSIEMAFVNANNDITAPRNSQLIAYMNKNTIENLKKSKKIKVVSYMYLPPSPPDVVIYENYYLDIVISVDVNYRTISK